MRGNTRPSNSFVWDIGIPTFSENDADGFVGVQVGVYGTDNKSSGCPAGEVHTPYGFYCRPLDPTIDADGNLDPTKSGQALYAWQGGQLHLIPLQDPRVVPNLPPLGKGEAMLYGREGQFVKCRNGGEVSMMTTDDATITGQSVFFQMKPTGFTRTAPWGTERFDATGWHATTTSGASIDIGGIGGIPGFGTFGSYAQLQAAMIRLNGASVSLGGGTVQDNVALSTPILAAFAAATTVIDAIGVVLASLVPVSGVTAPQLATFATALSAYNAAIAAAVPLMRSNQVTAALTTA